MTGKAGPIALDCFVYSGWRPRLRAASPRRDWMDATPERFAYRCLPLNIANAHGWEILSPCGFQAEWNGGAAVDDVTIRLGPGAEKTDAPVALFGQGTFTFHVSGLFRTSPGFDLWVGGSPNAAKDGVAPLNGIVETDWASFSFTMNWRFTRAHHPVRFEENEPFAFIFPIERGSVERVVPRIRAIDDVPDLKAAFEQWSASRDAFQAEVKAHPPASPAERWQKFYYRGTAADGSPGAADHRSKLRLPEFDGAFQFHREVSPGPAAGDTPEPNVAVQSAGRCPANAGPSAAKLAWLLKSLERLRSLTHERIPRRRGIEAEEFLHAHYAANWPVLLEGELDEWPALRRWTPDYLRERIGPRLVQVQANRLSDPDFERNMGAHRTMMPFDEFIDRIAAPETGNDLYLTAHNADANEEALAPLRSDLGFVSKLLSLDDDRPFGLIWIGAAGTFTPLHHDLSNNLLLQLAGRKRVLLVPPTETPRLYNDHHVYSRIRDLTAPDIVSRFPRLHGARVHELVMGPGEALFIPLGWWHQVKSLDFSVTITHTNFRWANDFHVDYPPVPQAAR